MGKLFIFSLGRTVSALLAAVVIVLSTLCVPAPTNAGALAQRIPGGVVRYEWRQGNPAIRMMSVRDGLCYLSGVQGKFLGGGELVSIWNKNGYWWLGGKSMQHGVAAEAMCVPSTSINNGWMTYDTVPAWVSISAGSCPGWPEGCARNWWHSQILRGSSSFCYLTGVSGNFDGQQKLSIVKQRDLPGALLNGDDSYYLLADTNTEKAYERVEGGCFEPAPPTSGYMWDEVNGTWDQGQRDTVLLNAREGFCFLTAVHGSFQGAGEGVSVWFSAGDNTWRLNGASQQSGVGAAARCFKFNPVSR